MTAHKRSAKIRFDMVVKILLVGKNFGLGAQDASMYPYIINYFISNFNRFPNFLMYIL